MKHYIKLVRDNIPNIIEKDKKIANTKILNDKEYIQYLYKKLLEEVNEYLEENDIDELADALEVIYNILEFHNISKDKIETLRIDKNNNNGSFKKRSLLESVESEWKYLAI